jgi:hypothetical protein
MRSISLIGVDLDLKSVEIYAFNVASIEIDLEFLFERVDRFDCQLVDSQIHSRLPDYKRYSLLQQRITKVGYEGIYLKSY